MDEITSERLMSKSDSTPKKPNKVEGIIKRVAILEKT